MDSSTSELAIVIERAAGLRWANAERLLSQLPLLGPLRSVDLAARPHLRLIIALLRFDQLSPDVEQRLAFWCRRLGGALLSLGEADLGQRANFKLQLDRSELRRLEVAPAELPAKLGQLKAALGAGEVPVAACGSLPVLPLDLLEPSVTELDAKGFFLSTDRPLPLGDKLLLELRAPGQPIPLMQPARATLARTLAQRLKGTPGVQLQWVEPAEAVTKLIASTVARRSATPARPDLSKASEPRPASPASGIERRTAPRYPVSTPVVVSTPQQRASLTYASAEAFSKDYVQNLSVGGAFIRTARAYTQGTELELDIQLPSGAKLNTRAAVVRVMTEGIGVQFWLSGEAKAALEAEVAELAAQQAAREEAAPPAERRRAMVVEDEKLAQVMVSDALAAGGFAVTPARDGAEAMRALLDELPNFDVLVTDLKMPGVNGEELIKRIRVDGGERDLVIVVYSATIAEPERLLALGADAVIQKGPQGPQRVLEAATKGLAERLARVSAPVAPVGAKPSAAAPPSLNLRFASAEDVAEQADELRMGGLFLPGEAPWPLETKLTLELLFPGGERFAAPAQVVSVDPLGNGLQLDLEPQQHFALVDVVDRYARSNQTPSEVTLRRLLSEPPPPPPSDRPAARLGNYELLSLLGRGGMAEVFFARASAGPRAGQVVAIKRLLPALAEDKEAVELFAGEADLLRLLEHPNIVRTYEVGSAGDAYYLVMEAIDGRDLGQVIRRCRQKGIQLPIDFAVFLVKVLLDALDYAHRAKSRSGQPLNIVHCDVSPSNLFISRTGEIKLGDFGVAQAAGTKAGRVVGKTHYLSPEALEGASDVFTDLWAANVCLYELLTLERPFRGQTPEEVFAEIRDRRYQPVHELRPDVPRALSAVVDRGFAKRPEKRFRNAADFGAALEPHFNPLIGTPLAIASVIRGLFDSNKPAP